MIIRFLVIGVLNTFIYYLLYVLLIFLNLHYTVAVIIATLITMFLSFKTFGIFVFKNNDNRLIYRFILVTVVNYILTVTIIYTLNKLGYNSYLSGGVATFLVALNSFTLNRFFVFV